MTHFVNKYGDEFHGFEEGGVPEEEVGEEVAAHEGEEDDFFVPAAAGEGPVGVGVVGFF